MERHSGRLDIRKASCRSKNCPDAVVGDAEFVTLLAGRDLLMRVGIDIGVDAESGPLPSAERRRNVVQCFELRFGFDIDLADSGHDGLRQLLTALTDAGKDD